jgi:DNA-binding transcriptional LysR family regulator
MVVNIHHLELFYYVAKNRGISAAVRHIRYGIQQPAISGQVRALEKHLGLELFQRRPFALKPAGRALFSAIEPFFESLESLPAKIRGEAISRLRLAAPATILRDHFPPLLSAEKKRCPNLQLSRYDTNQAGAEDLLHRQEIDLAVVELEASLPSRIQSRRLLTLPLVLLAPVRSRIRTLNDLPGEIMNHRLICLPSDEVITKHFQSGLKELSLSWRTAIEVASLDLIEKYVALGFGVGVSVAVPRRKLVPATRRILLPRFPPLTIAALWRDSLSEPAQRFLGALVTLAQKIDR